MFEINLITIDNNVHPKKRESKKKEIVLGSDFDADRLLENVHNDSLKVKHRYR